ncbi:sigma-70 family RNA polymerase sigma factor [Pseudoflavitalea sp. X16]|uniref:RNA polymerase sigma factor n=1 Tax=Paraflavitalea devenefica TaxID=2716334 RepID=UPI0014248319|nr:sigma-70 family RNA polymerase sigma factor [Paraflavitalea devenefica]NII27773.1 sigma-70 family RNA polymerase sigma factor [Paraflavitalea devenefica]
MTEEELIKRLKAGDELAHKKIFTLYYEVILVFVTRFVPNPIDAAKDITQETFIALALNAPTLPKLATLSDVRAFLYVVARNKAIDHLKAKMRSDEFLREYFAFNGCVADPNEAATFVRENEIHAQITQYLQSLSDQQQAIIDLLISGNYTIKQISEKLETSEGNVRNQKHKVVQKLRELIKTYESNTKVVDTLIKIILYIWSFIHAIF